MMDHREAKQYSNTICFLEEEVVLQVCHLFNDHKVYSVSVDDINLINFKFKF